MNWNEGNTISVLPMQGIVSTSTVHFCTYSITPKIRWYRSVPKEDPILQQASQCIGCGKLIWENIDEVAG